MRVAAGPGPFEAVLGPARVFSAPEAGLSALLPLVAPGAAGALFFPGADVASAPALELGLVDVLAEEGSALPAALARASLLTTRALPALAAAKIAFAADRLAALDRALAREREISLSRFRDGSLAASLAAAARMSTPQQEIA